MEGFFSRLQYKEENKYVLHSVDARTYCTNKRIEYYNMCNTATLRTVGLHIVLTCLSGSGAFPLLRAVGTMLGARGRSHPPPQWQITSTYTNQQVGYRLCPPQYYSPLHIFKPPFVPAPRHGISFVL